MKKLVAAVLLWALSLTSTCALAADALPSWNEGKSKQSIVTFVMKVTTPGSADFVPPEERRQAGLLRREAALHVARAQDLPSQDRLRPALERNGTELAVLEVPPGQPAGVRANHDRAGLGERL